MTITICTNILNNYKLYHLHHTALLSERWFIKLMETKIRTENNVWILEYIFRKSETDKTLGKFIFMMHFCEIEIWNLLLRDKICLSVRPSFQERTDQINFVRPFPGEGRIKSISFALLREKDGRNSGFCVCVGFFDTFR